MRPGDPEPRVTAFLRATNPDLIWASVLSFGEIRKGIERLAPGRRRTELEHWLYIDLEQWFEERLLPVTKTVAFRWGVMNALSLDRGRPIPTIDGLIAATALVNDLTVVTRNIRDFGGLDLAMLNPWD